MLIYDSNKNWFRDLFRITRTKIMFKVIRSSFLIVLFDFLLTYNNLQFIKSEFRDDLQESFAFIGIVLSILLVFRTNTAYDRWWEGRKLWGSLVNNCRNFAIYLHTYLPENEKEERQFFAYRISNFCLAMVEHLRQGTKVETLLGLNQAEIEAYQKKEHVPNFIIYELWHRVNQRYEKGVLRDMQFLNIKDVHQELLNILGGCERIKKTPIPFSYNVFLKIFILLYIILFPIVVSSDLGWWSVPISGIVSFAFIGIEMMGDEIENPFGVDDNDLPTQQIALNIKDNVCEIFGLEPIGNHALSREAYTQQH